MRATGNFHETSIEPGMAIGRAFDEAAPLSAARAQARLSMLSAISAMDHWNHRGAALAAQRSTPSLEAQPMPNLAALHDHANACSRPAPNRYGRP